MSTVPVIDQRVPLDLIDLGENVRELDERHVETLAASIALRDLIVPVVLRERRPLHSRRGLPPLCGVPETQTQRHPVHAARSGRLER
jgi:hypothetical protein